MLKSRKQSKADPTGMMSLSAALGPRGPWHVHPATMAILSGSLCIALSFFPPDLYSSLIEEPNYMFGNINLIFFIIVCTLSFCFGTMLTMSAGLRKRRQRARLASLTHRRTLLIPLAASIVAALIGIGTAAEFVGNPALFLAALATGSAESSRGSAVGDAFDGGFSILSFLPIGFPLLVWSIFQATCHPSPKRGRRKVVLGCAVIYGLCLVLTLQRNLLIPYLLCIFIVLSGQKWHPQGIPIRKLLGTIVSGAVLIIALFTLIAYFRGGDSQSPLTVLTGYIPASINRLAALLQDVLHPAISGEPYYSFRLFWHPPLVRRFIPIDEFGRSLGLSIPDSVIEGWIDEFHAISVAGLNPVYIWATTFGYTFYDFGWLSPIYFLMFGGVAGIAWNQFQQRSAFGIIFLPYFVTSVLLWSTDNFLALPQVWLFFAAACMLSVFDKPNRFRRHDLKARNALAHAGSMGLSSQASPLLPDNQSIS